MRGVSFSEKAPAAINNKLQLFGEEPARFAVRAMMAGVYLSIMTAFAGATGTLLESYAPGWGKYIYGSLFAVTLYIIVVLQGELATGDMMYMTYGAIHRMAKFSRGLLLVLMVTFFNLVGAVLIAWLISRTTIGHDALVSESFLSSMMEDKMRKSTLTLFAEAILANIVVNIAFFLCTQAGKDYAAQLQGVIIVIPAFATMGYEHSIANFSATALTAFMFDPSTIDGFTVGNILHNWVVVWLGNFVGGGLIMGGIYAWLNLTKTEYKD